MDTNPIETYKDYFGSKRKINLDENTGSRDTSDWLNMGAENKEVKDDKHILSMLCDYYLDCDCISYFKYNSEM